MRRIAVKNKEEQKMEQQKCCKECKFGMEDCESGFVESHNFNLIFCRQNDTQIHIVKDDASEE